MSKALTQVFEQHEAALRWERARLARAWNKGTNEFIRAALTIASEQQRDHPQTELPADTAADNQHPKTPAG